MKSKRNIVIVLVLVLVLVSASCSHKNSRNYQFMPNMYEPVGYETYGEIGFLPNGMEAGLPVEGTIARGWLPYEYDNSLEGKEAARWQESPLDSIAVADNLNKGKQLYTVYCAICHGDKGDGKGYLVQREKLLGIPTYADAARDITVGSTYHTIYHGLNAMGSYAGQLNIEERWQVAEYVMKLKEDLTK
ncbi:cytochrome c [Arenibacter sp. GZD96]|uniref:c-type cytochrome n=1 Tax=Aurantibrevibacter litoralis TaxID=3106030 RepID=UPI002B003724|nr:cytochrome c [Arenibacter sp. GZD-96]MEA1784587.1 cytochrome c [Arenibacter sp. GZD-96]